MKNRVLVTGGATGIGKSISLELAKSGYHVICGFNSSASAAEELGKIKFASGGAIFPEKLNLSSLMDLESGVHEIFRKHGEVGSLVNNAALSQHKNFLEITESDIDSILQVNLKAPFYLSQKFLETMINHNWGRIINIVSVGGQWGGTKQIHYAAAKASLIGLTKSIAKSYSGFGVTCNAISPGYIDTEMFRAEASGEALERLLPTIPVGRVGSPDEVASAVKFLISEESSYISGQTLNINGGILFS
jgi:NAD(P)-dependent dehydrogenase (short-subunit alcohol dehydrogenase family)